VDLNVEFSPNEIEEVLHEEVAFFGKPAHQHFETGRSRDTGAGTVPRAWNEFRLFYQWRSKYGGMDASMMARMKEPKKRPGA
jgi:hypothetical protein